MTARLPETPTVRARTLQTMSMRLVWTPMMLRDQVAEHTTVHTNHKSKLQKRNSQTAISMIPSQKHKLLTSMRASNHSQALPLMLNMTLVKTLTCKKVSGQAISMACFKGCDSIICRVGITYGVVHFQSLHLTSQACMHSICMTCLACV